MRKKKRETEKGIGERYTHTHTHTEREREIVSEKVREIYWREREIHGERDGDVD